MNSASSAIFVLFVDLQNASAVAVAGQQQQPTAATAAAAQYPAQQQATLVANPQLQPQPFNQQGIVLHLLRSVLSSFRLPIKITSCSFVAIRHIYFNRNSI